MAFSRASIAGLFGGAVAAGIYLMQPAMAENEIVRALCIMHPDNPSQDVRGVVRLTQVGAGPTQIEAEITGMQDGAHGFHIHMYGDFSNGCTSAGGHYNPFGKTHGGPGKEERHVGDLGNIVSSGGVAKLSLQDPMVQLRGPTSVVGRSFVVHAGTDDLGEGGHDDSKTTGHAGARLACGVIGLAA